MQKSLQICENVQRKKVKRYLKHVEVSGRVFQMKVKKKGDKTL